MSARPYTLLAQSIVAGFFCDATKTRQNLEATQSTMHSALDRDAWLAALERIAAALGPSGQPVRLCLIGSVASPVALLRGRPRDPHFRKTVLH